MSSRTDRMLRIAAAIVIALLTVFMACLLFCSPAGGKSKPSQDTTAKHSIAEPPFKLNPDGPRCPDDEGGQLDPDETLMPNAVHAIKNRLTMPLLWPPQALPARSESVWI